MKKPKRGYQCILSKEADHSCQHTNSYGNCTAPGAPPCMTAPKRRKTKA